MKHISLGFSVFLCLAVLLGITVSARAPQTPPVCQGTVESLLAGPIVNVNEAIEADIYKALLAHEASVDLSAYQIPLANLTQATDAYFRCRDEHPELFYTTHQVSYTYHGTDVLSLEFSYSYNKEESEQVLTQINAEFEAMRKTIPAGVSDVEIALLLHDYFCLHYEYDYQNYLDGTLPDASYGAEGVLLYGKGVCQSYALAYKWALSFYDIECEIVTSEAMNHEWNLVKLGDDWYHVDLVYDDPVWDRYGKAEHEYFLISDTAIGSAPQPHVGWNAGHLCTATTYEDKVWRSSEAGTVAVNGNLYLLLTTGEIICYNEATGSRTDLYTISDHWFVPGTDKKQYYPGIHAALTYQGGLLYFNTSTDILSLTLDGKTAKVVYTPETGDTYLYAVMAEENRIGYALSESPASIVKTGEFVLYVPITSVALSWQGEKPEVAVGAALPLQATLNEGGAVSRLIWTAADPSLVSIADGVIRFIGLGQTTIRATSPDDPTVYDEKEVSSYLQRGDANLDGTVDGRDAIFLAQYLAHWYDGQVVPTLVLLACDVEAEEGAAQVNTRDAILLAQYLAKWPVTLGRYSET